VRKIKFEQQLTGHTALEINELLNGIIPFAVSILVYVKENPTFVTGALAAFVAYFTYRASKQPYINASIHEVDGFYFLHLENMSQNFARNIILKGRRITLNDAIMRLGTSMDRSFLGHGVVSIPSMYSYRCMIGPVEDIGDKIRNIGNVKFDIFGFGPIFRFSQKKCKFDLSPILGIRGSSSIHHDDGSIEDLGKEKLLAPIHRK